MKYVFILTYICNEVFILTYIYCLYTYTFFLIIAITSMHSFCNIIMSYQI